MKLVQMDEVAYNGGVNYDSYLLRDDTGKVIHLPTKNAAHETEVKVNENEAFRNIRRQITNHYFRILKDEDTDSGYLVQLLVERPLNTAPKTIELN